MFRALRETIGLMGNDGRKKVGKAKRRLQFESLEARKLLTANLMLDFGDAFPGGYLNSSSADWSSAAGPGGVAFAPASFRIQRFADIPAVASLDYDGNGVANAADVTALRTAIVAQVASYFAPFDVLVTTRSAATPSAVRTNLNAVNTDQDAYMVIGKYEYLFAGVYQPMSTTAGGVTPGADAASQTNAIEETASIFADQILSVLSSASATGKKNGLAYTIAHEAGHAFGLRHVANPNVSYASSEIMTQSASFAQRIRDDNFFSRVPMPYAPGEGTGTFNPYDRLNANVGPNASLSRLRFTGTGGSDNITVAFYSPSTVLMVTVPANANAGSGGITYGISLPAGPYNIANPTRIPIEIYGGADNDQISIDSSISSFLPAGLIVDVRVVGQSGADYVQTVGTTSDDVVRLFKSDSIFDGSVNRFLGGNLTQSVSFDNSVEDAVYDTNGGNDSVSVQANLTTGFRVRKTGTTGAPTLTVNGTINTAYDDVTLSAYSGAIPGLLNWNNGMSKTVFFYGIDTVTYNSNGGNDLVTILPSTTTTFTATNLSGGDVKVLVKGSSAVENVTLNGEAGGANGSVVVNNIAGRKPVFFKSTYEVVYATEGGGDTVNVTANFGNQLGVKKTGASTDYVTLEVRGTSGNDSLNILPESNGATGVINFGGSFMSPPPKPIVFSGGVTRVNYNSVAGLDAVSLSAGSVNEFAFFGNATLNLYGTSASDSVTIDNAGFVSLGKITTVGYKNILFQASINSIYYAGLDGNDVVTVRSNAFTASITVDGGNGFDTLYYQIPVTAFNIEQFFSF